MLNITLEIRKIVFTIYSCSSLFCIKKLIVYVNILNIIIISFSSSEDGALAYTSE